MKLKSIFNKSVGRPIEGVIKADDETCLHIEVEEYILTNEIENRIESFLNSYNNFQGANGVWISGFFGSGKSHLLKMLALLLENRQVDDDRALDLFIPKLGGNQFLLAEIQKAVNIPSKSILFNIDQKADVISKFEVDALLAVFVKVFDQMCGYYGKQGHIAQFERDLDKRGLFEQFQSNYRSVAGIDWTTGREQALFEANNIAKAYSQTTGDDKNVAFGIIDKYREQYSVSIEDFANQVNAYIEQQQSNFRLNFFVDEVGQYIADNIKLMTNLQTIAESLATKCKGRAWIFVTAQEDMEKVIGERDKKQANDFSKIQDRFSNRMQLTSADVAEVIQKRLLVKTDEAITLLTDLYCGQSNNFKTLFNFVDGSKSYRNFQDQDHFISSYPFVPYQFDLFQSCIKALSDHNAFEGQHSSVGERSMLSVFQKVVIDIEKHGIGQLAAFDSMFEGIRSALKSQIQGAIIQSEKNLDNQLAIRLLKTLLLIKYVKEDLKPTIRNLCVLVIDNFNQDISTLRMNVEGSLNLLEQQTYIQRNGEHYEYLTNEEKDIEQEIKNTQIEQSEVSNELQEIIFQQIIKQSKIRHDKSKCDYPFSRKLDSQQYGRDHELGINIITSFHEDSGNEKLLANLSAKHPDDLLVVLPPDARLAYDLSVYKRTEKYVRQNISATQAETTERILEQKRSQNHSRYNDLKIHVQSQIGSANIFVAGERIEPGSGEAQTRVTNGFQKLITSTYTNLGMLRGIIYTENDITKYLQSSDSGLIGNNATSLTETESELLTAIQSNRDKGLRTTLKFLLEKFERRPYGWHYAAILCTLSMLCARSKVEVRIDGNLLEENDKLEQAFRNTHGHGNVLLDPQIEFSSSQVHSLKDFFQGFFDTEPDSSEARSLGRQTGEKFQAKLNELNQYVDQKSQYPFLCTLEPIVELLRQIVGKPYSWYLEEFQQKNDLLSMKEDVIDPILKFMNGSQKVIFDDAQNIAQVQRSNLSYIESNEVEELQSLLNASDCFKGNGMQRLKQITGRLKQNIDTQINDEVLEATQKVAGLENKLCGMQEFNQLDDERQTEIRIYFRQAIEEIENQNLIAAIRDMPRKFEELTYPKLLSLLTSTDQQSSPIENNEYVPFSSVNLNSAFDRAWIANEEDLDVFLGRLREILLNKIRDNKRIQI